MGECETKDGAEGSKQVGEREKKWRDERKQVKEKKRQDGEDDGYEVTTAGEN